MTMIYFEFTENEYNKLKSVFTEKLNEYMKYSDILEKLIKWALN